MSEKYKNVTIKSHEYRIGKFNAMDGAFIIPKVTGLLAPVLDPLFKGFDVKQIAKKPEDMNLSNLNFAALLAPLAKIPEDDFVYLQKKCLSVCQVKFQSGYQPVIHDNGSLSLAELEDDSMTILALMVHTLIHNFSGFFGESLFTGLLGTILPTNSHS